MEKNDENVYDYFVACYTILRLFELTEKREGIFPFFFRFSSPAHDGGIFSFVEKMKNFVRN